MKLEAIGEYVIRFLFKMETTNEGDLVYYNLTKKTIVMFSNKKIT